MMIEKVFKISVLMCCVCMVSCSPSPESGPESVMISLPETCSGARYNLEIFKHLATLQEQPNTLALYQDHTVLVLESGTNAISAYEQTTGQLNRNFSDIGNDHNPYDFAIAQSEHLAFVSNNLANSFSVVDLMSGDVVQEVVEDTMLSPSGVAVSQDFVFVSDVQFGMGDNGFGRGMIHLFDRRSLMFLGSLHTEQQNPHYLHYLEDSDELLVVNSGAVGFVDGHYRQRSDGGISLWKFHADDPLNPEQRNAPVPVFPDTLWRDGAPGRPLITADGEHMYFVSATSPVLLKLDRGSLEWEIDPAMPHVLYETSQDALHAAAMMGDGLAFVLAFNQDALYVFDTTCDKLIAGPVDLGLSEEDLEGPLAIVSDGALRAHFITSLSKRLGAIYLRPQ